MQYPLVICCDSAQSLPTTTCSSSPPPPHQEPEITPAPSAFTAVDIKNILSKTIVGTDIISKYKTNKSLEESDQTAIAKIGVDDLFLNGVKMDPKIMKKVADAIVDLFPTENSLMYYTPRTAKRTPSGKLYSRYFNMIYKRKQASDGSSQAKKIRNVEPSADTLHHNEEYMSMKVWLSENIPENLMAVWKETSKYRMNDRMDLEKMLDEWPRYKDPNGPELINIDFENLYEGKGNNMFRKMEDFEKQFDEDFFVSQIKDKQNLQYLTRLKSVELPLGRYSYLN